MSFTVTATQSGSSVGAGVNLVVRVLTGATEAGGASGGTNATIAKGSITPAGTNSYIAFSISEDNLGVVMGTAATNCTYDQNVNNAGHTWSSAQGHFTGTVTSGTPVATGEAAAAGGGDHWNWCAYEVLSSGGSTPTLDGSSPAAVNTPSALFIATASFTPPTGAVLVAEVCAGGSGSGTGVTMSITDSAGLGMVWTRQAVSSTSDNFQPTWIYTTTVPGTFTGIGGSRQQALPGQTWRTYFRNPQWQPQIAPTLPPPVPPPQQQAQPGRTWKNQFHLPARPKMIAPVNPAVISGLAGGGSGYFVDQVGNPRLYYATVPWGMPANAGRWNGGDWSSDIDQYFSTIAAQGFTASEMHAFGHSHTGCNNDIGNTWDGVSPWSGSLPALNNTFWLRIDTIFQAANTFGITVAMDLTMQCDMGLDAFAGTGVFNGVSAANVQSACQNIAARYINQPNVIWFFGDDYNNDDETRMNAALAGVRAAGYTGPTSIEYYSSGTTSREDLSSSPTNTPFAWGGSNATYNWCYYYSQTYFAVEQAYKENSQIPVVWGDGYYIVGLSGGGGEPADSHLMRNFVWWALASGARGVTAGSETILNWQSTAMTDQTVSQTYYPSYAKAIYTAFTNLPGWWNLLPDLTSALVTAGRGTRAVYSAGNFLGANLGSDNYVAASRTPDGSLAVIYCAVAMSITINQAKLGAGYTATWIDPANGATQVATPGSTYNSTPLGNNSAGNTDWVLALQGPPNTAGASVTPATLAVTTTTPAPAVTGNGIIPLVIQAAVAAPAQAPVIPSQIIFSGVTTANATATPATLAVSTTQPAPAVSPGPATLAVSTTAPLPAVSPGPATLAISSSIATPAVITSPFPATLAVSTSFPAPAVITSPFPATLAVSTAQPLPAVSPGPATLAVSTAQPLPAVSPGPATLAVSTAQPLPAVSPGPATLAVSTSQPLPLFTPAPLTLAVATAQPLPAVSPGPATLAVSTAFPAPLVSTGPLPATLAVSTAQPAPAVSPGPATLAVSTSAPLPAVSPGPATLAVSTIQPAPAVSPGPATLAVSTSAPVPAVITGPFPATLAVSTAEPAPAVSPGPATLAVSTSQPLPLFNPSPFTLAVSTSFPSASVSPVPGTLAVSTSIPAPTVVTGPFPAIKAVTTAQPAPAVSPGPATVAVTALTAGDGIGVAVSPGPATLAISTSQPIPPFTPAPLTLAVTALTAGDGIGVAVSPGPATLAVSTSIPAPTVVAGGATSPGLEIYGFGSFAGISPTTVLSNITVALGEFASAAGMQGATFELWDGTSTRIGAIQTGAASTSAVNVDMAAFTAVTYSQLATLRVRAYGHSGSAISGSTESWDWASLTAVFIEPRDIASPTPLAVITALPLPAVAASSTATVPTAGPASVATALPAPTAGLLNALIGVTPLAITAGFPISITSVSYGTTATVGGPAAVAATVPTPSAMLLNALISVPVLAITTTIPGSTASVTYGVTVPSAGPAAVATTVPVPTAMLLNATISVSKMAVFTSIGAVAVAVIDNITVVISSPIAAPMAVQAPVSVSTNTSGPNYATNADTLSGGTGVIGSMGNVTGAPDGQSTIWTTP